MKTFLIILLTLIPFSAQAFNLWTDPEQGSLLVGKITAGNKLYYGENRIKTANDGRFLLGIGRDAPDKIILTEKQWYGLTTKHTVRIKDREWKIQRINGLDQKKVNPPASEIPRIQKESALIKAAKKQSMTTNFPTCFIVPILGSRISGVFGSQRILNGEPKNYHGGIDYAAPTGTPVRATAKGKVALIHEDMYYSGKTIIIDHGFGVFSTYIHLSRIFVKEGDIVRQGEDIGRVGSTGRSTGPHLHFGIDWNGVRIDPQTAISNKICPTK